MANPILKKVRKIDNTVKQNFRATSFSSSKLDGFFKWLPIMSVFAFDLGGIRTRDNFKKTVKIVCIGESVLNGIILPLKKVTHRRRPDDFFKFNSFPSGHTATSFLGAEILHDETKQIAPILSLSGYAIAITTATLRLYKRKHWLSDVIAGATIGIISARVAYRLSK